MLSYPIYTRDIQARSEIENLILDFTVIGGNSRILMSLFGVRRRFGTIGRKGKEAD